MSIDINIKKRLGNFTLDVSFYSDRGVVGLLGASGCGKTITLKCIAGIMTPDEGHIELNGKTLFDSHRLINLPPQRRGVGYLFQNYALFPNMTVEQNIACGLRREKDAKARAGAVAETIGKMRLSGLERRRPHQLSGGQQQRAALARILVGNPDILLLDEPMSALDNYIRDHVLNELESMLHAFGKDALLVTHNRDEAYQLCGTLAIMDNGRVMRMGGTKEVFADPGTRAAALLTGCKDITAARKAGPRLVEAPEWGVVFDAGRPVDDGVCAIGIRAHYFGSDIEENSFPVKIDGMLERPFEWTIKFRYEKQDENSEQIWWRVPKTEIPPARPQRLGVLPKDILLFYA